MQERTRILVPLDGSPVGECVLLALDPLVRTRQVDLTLIHVVESGASADGPAERLAFHQKSLQELNVAVRVRIVPGKPAEEILRQEATGDFDLVAMATHGRTGMDRVVLGSIAEQVVRSSTVPTLLCKPKARRASWNRIVVALDGNPGSEEILGDVVRLARSTQAQVHLLRVGLGLLRMDGYRGAQYKFVDQQSGAYLASIAERLTSHGVDAVPEWREGIAGWEITRLARELDADLICMTTEGRPELIPGLDRSVAAEVIRNAPCPVYVRRMVGGAQGNVLSRKEVEAG